MAAGLELLTEEVERVRAKLEKERQLREQRARESQEELTRLRIEDMKLTLRLAFPERFHSIIDEFSYEIGQEEKHADFTLASFTYRGRMVGIRHVHGLKYCRLWIDDKEVCQINWNTFWPKFVEKVAENTPALEPDQTTQEKHSVQ